MTFHPREGWSEDGSRRNPGMSRRTFLAGAAATGLAARPGRLPVRAVPPPPPPTDRRPSRWPCPAPTIRSPGPLYASNPAIADGLKPEKNATLKIYNWVAYVNQKDLDAFAKKYNCKVELTTFNTMSEAIAKLRSGEFNFDVFVPTVDVLGQLVAGKLARPLNHSYIPNISQAWTQYQNPFYDQKWQYTVPYTIYTTGIAWRKDKVDENPYAMANPWAMPWNVQVQGEGGHPRRLPGEPGPGHDEERQLRPQHHRHRPAERGHQLAARTGPAGQPPHRQQRLHLHPHRPDLDPPRLVGRHGRRRRRTCPRGPRWRWSATGSRPTGMGPVANDTMTVLAGGKNPVLAHLFLNYMLDLPNVLENISFNGYMQPVNGVTPQVLEQEGILPPSLASTVVLPVQLRHRDQAAGAGPGRRRRVPAGMAAGQRRRVSGAC